MMKNSSMKEAGFPLCSLNVYVFKYADERRNNTVNRIHQGVLKAEIFFILQHFLNFLL